MTTFAEPISDCTPPARSTIANRTAVAVLLVAGFGTLCSFYLPLSVAPDVARAAGGTGAAGLVNGALLLATVAGELVTPMACRRLGTRRVLAAGLVLMALPALALVGAGSVSMLVATSALRGLGFALAGVSCGSAVTALFPAERRGTGLAIYGVVVSVPSFVALPLGVWLGAHVGPGVVGVATCACALAALVGVLAPSSPTSGPEHFGLATALRRRGLVGRAGMFAATTAIVGIVTAFLPLALGTASAALAAVALFVHALVATIARFVSGVLDDRRPNALRLAPCLLCCAVGTAGMAFTSSAPLLLAGVVVFSLGFGAAQNAALLPMLRAVPESGYAATNALWDLGYDGGMALGALGFGAAAGALGYSGGFVLFAVLIAAVAVVGRGF